MLPNALMKPHNGQSLKYLSTEHFHGVGKGGRLVSAKARKIVEEFLSIISSPDTVLDKLDECAIRMERVAEEVVPALAEASTTERARSGLARRGSSSTWPVRGPT